MKSSINDLFKRTQVNLPTHTNDEVIISQYITALQAFSRLTYQSIYVIDYEKKAFPYVSENPLFLCGYSAKEVKLLGFEFYLKTVPPQDLNMLLDIDTGGNQFFNQLSFDEKTKITFSYDFHICSKNMLSPILINHKVTPLAIRENGAPWLSICFVSISSYKSPGHFYVQMNDSDHRYDFNFTTKKWKQHRLLQLKNREKEIILSSAKGFSNEMIAKHLNISVETVKFHKKNIFLKLDVKNITEALSVVVNKNLI